MTSGLIQYGVPTRDLRLGKSGETWAQKPKSDNFTWKKYANYRNCKQKFKKKIFENPCRNYQNSNVAIFKDFTVSFLVSKIRQNHQIHKNHKNRQSHKNHQILRNHQIHKNYNISQNHEITKIPKIVKFAEINKPTKIGKNRKI